jgi:LmbE family N-acetylglucosaminyl deacetylase
MKSRSQESGIRSLKGLTEAQREWRAWPLLILFVWLAIAAIVFERSVSAAPLEGVEDDAADIYQSLLDLQNPWTVMCVAAHPDDEDGSTLTLLRRKYGVHTVTVFSTYGEGGQNAVGPELYEELGAIRARETLSAARIQGSEAYFLGLRDFGFSKSSEEAFRFWGHEEALRRMVLKIRELRPDIIITNHDTTSGHGHHQATGLLVMEAFDAAADPHRFPEQLKNGVTIWQPQRLFVRFQFEGSGSKAAEDEAARTAHVVTIDRSERDQVRAATYAEQALRALREHASQGPWPQTVPAGWATPIRYRLARSAKDVPPLPQNPQTFFDGISLPRSVADELTPLAAKALTPLFNAPTARSTVIRTLVAARRSIIEALINASKGGLSTWLSGETNAPRFRLMADRLNHALAAASGVKATLTPLEDVLIPGTNTGVTLKIRNGGAQGAIIRGISLSGLRPSSKLKYPQTLAPGASLNVELRQDTPRTAPLSRPHSEHLYDGRIFGEELSATVKVEIDGATFPLEAKTRMDVAPAVEIASVTPSPLVLTQATTDLTSPTTPTVSIAPESSAQFTLRLVNHQNRSFKGEIIIGRAASRNAARKTAFTLAANEGRELKVQRDGRLNVIDLVRGNTHPLPNIITFDVVGDGSQRIIAQRRVRVVWADARTAPNLLVGYVRSYDDTLRDSLAALGVKARELTVDDVRAGNLAGYSAIIIDNRGYQAHPELIQANQRLLDYAREGGTLIVFYHKTNEWNPDTRVSRPQLAPYPITLGNSRVTDETAPIEFTEAAHPLLNYPNKLTAQDFAGWVQERGLYYPQTWDAHYSAPLSTSDTGEAALRGGLLAADYGRGRYIYTSMVWYRQLRAGIPGAYRALANMISYGR